MTENCGTSHALRIQQKLRARGWNGFQRLLQGDTCVEGSKSPSNKCLSTLPWAIISLPLGLWHVLIYANLFSTHVLRVAMERRWYVPNCNI